MKAIAEGVKLDSMSLFPGDDSLFKGELLGHLLKLNFGKYKLCDFKTVDFSSANATLPAVFTKPLKAYAEPELSELAILLRLAGAIRYNFSDGAQISAHEILRSPYKTSVPAELLPQANSIAIPFMSWPLLEGVQKQLISGQVEQVIQIVQPLIAQIVQNHAKKKIDLYLQSLTKSQRALKIHSVEFDPNQEFFWRIEFIQDQSLTAVFSLMGIRKAEVRFFKSFALDLENEVLIVHPWFNEFERIQEELETLVNDHLSFERGRLKFTISGEFEIRSMIKFLRKRSIGLSLQGETKYLAPEKHVTELFLQPNGYFYIQHRAQRPSGEFLVRRGFSLNSQVLLQTLSEGISFLLRSDSKEIASRESRKRQWDLKLLKHSGITHFLTFASLQFHFETENKNSQVFTAETFFLQLQPAIKKFLLDTASFVAFGHLALDELCSKPVLRVFENFVAMIFANLKLGETFFSESGELVLEGLVEREHRIIYELLKNRILCEGRQYFEKAKSRFAENTSNFQSWYDMNADAIEFVFSKGQKGVEECISSALDASHTLKLFNCRLYFNENPVHEMLESELKIDFALTNSFESKNINWFELDPTIFLEGTPVAIDEIFKLRKGQRLIEHGGKSYLLPKSQLPLMNYLENFWLNLQKVTELKTSDSKKQKRKPTYQVHNHRILELLSLRAKGVAMRGDHSWQELCNFYDRLGENLSLSVAPHGLLVQLKNYQLSGLYWLYDLYRLNLGALLADEMGLGKTLQALSFLLKLKSEDRLSKNLIVVPSTLIFNWQNEAKKFAPELPISVFSKKEISRLGIQLESTREIVLLVSYGHLVEHQQFLSQYNWNVVVFDEAQNLKNIFTRRSKASRSLKSTFKLALTGTPMENNYAEFYSIIDLVLPGSLGKLEDFRRKFVNTDLITREEMDQLRVLLKPIVLRRTKKQVAIELPEKQEVKLSIAFDEEQLQIYRDVAISYNEQVKEALASNAGEVQLRMLTALLRLRQVCSDPTNLPNVSYNKIPPKIKTLASALKEIVANGESALIFTQFLQTMRTTEELLLKAGLNVLVLHGAQSASQRRKILEKFETSKEPQILLMTMKTGGVGLNLVKASYVFHLEPWWNPAVENQATDRVHRLGQVKAVQVIRYVMHNSLEEKIELLKDRKSEKFQALMGGDAEIDASDFGLKTQLGFSGEALTKSDFQLLLGLTNSKL